MNTSERLRADRMVFYERDIKAFEEILDELVRMSAAKCAFLVDREGHMVAHVGEHQDFDIDTISALVAGSFAATREMARLLGEEEFTVMFHEGHRDNLQVNLVGDRAILTVIFDDRTTVGMVRLYAGEAGAKLTELVERSSGDESQDLGIAEDYDASGRARLDSLFS